MTEKMETAPKKTFLAYWNGFGIYENPDLSPGWIQMRNAKGEVLASINTVAEVHIAKAPPLIGDKGVSK